MNVFHNEEAQLTSSQSTVDVSKDSAFSAEPISTMNAVIENRPYHEGFMREAIAMVRFFPCSITLSCLKTAF